MKHYLCTVTYQCDPASGKKPYSLKFHVAEPFGLRREEGITLHYRWKGGRFKGHAYMDNVCAAGDFGVEPGEEAVFRGKDENHPESYSVRFDEVEGKELLLVVVHSYSDGSSSLPVREISEVIDVDGDSLREGEPLPGWKWEREGKEAPVVTYYDGESLEFDHEGETREAYVDGPRLELFKEYCSETTHNVESYTVYLQLGKFARLRRLPSWAEMHARGSYNAIIHNALPLLGTSLEAARWFARVFSADENMFLLLPETVELLRGEAEAGSPYALFALGRYHLCVCPGEDSRRKAMDCFGKAWDMKLPEAAVALAMAYDKGEMDIIDKPRAQELLDEALREGCEYAADYQVYRLLFWVLGFPGDPREALETCDALIAKDIEAYGADGVNPKWYYYKGCAKRKLYGDAHGLEEFQSAAAAGLNKAWTNVAIARSHDDEGKMRDWKAFLSAVERGATRRNATCAYHLACSKVAGYDRMSDIDRYSANRRYIENLEEAVRLGSAMAACELGSIYRKGLYGVGCDRDKALKYYAIGARWRDAGCMECMFEIYDGAYTEIVPPETVERLALEGARSGSRVLAFVVVRAYRQGRYAEYAEEIERWYVPVYEKWLHS